MPQAFEFTDVTRVFPDFRLGPINLALEPGTALGYIGPNGSGKTTTTYCLMGLLEITSGEIEVFGCRNYPHRTQWKKDIGYVGDVHAFYERWTGEQNLLFRSRYYPNWSHQRAIELSERFQLPLHRRAMELSSGNRVKLSEKPVGFPGAVSISQQGTTYQLISSNRKATLACLAELNAEGIQANRMALEEIAVQIIRGGRKMLS